MNAVEIEEAVSQLAAAPFDAAEFPFAFLAAFGNKPTTIKKLRTPSGNKSDVEGGVLQYRQIHLAVAPEGQVSDTLHKLRESAKTKSSRVKFILATDGQWLEAEDMASGEPLACDYPDFADRFAFFLPLAGITTVGAIKNNPIDIKATARLNKLYVQLLQDNPEWGTDARRHDLNQFMARLIFCFFAEDTGIFLGENLFTRTLEQMSDRDNAHDIIAELFRAMDIPTRERAGAGLRPWANAFPYVNGGLFAGTNEVPRFSRIARSYLLHAGNLDWKAINPDIFGSMIQAVAEDEERGELGMHYTSVPNILKVLNPLFLDDLRAQLEEAGDNPRKLLNLRRRLGRIRVFDPACGSGNFLVIAYKELRAIESEIIERRLRVLSEDAKAKEPRESVIPLKNFFGIEIKDFACEIARLSLLIAEYQCDVDAMGQERAGEIVLPLKETGRVVCGNALRLDWLEVCPPPDQVSAVEEDLAGPTGRLALEPGDGGDWETYICGNPPYKGGTEQTELQKSDMALLFADTFNAWKSLDYILGFFLKAKKYLGVVSSKSAFVTTNSVCQGEQVFRFWPTIISEGTRICFAVTSFRWANLATRKAAVSVCIVGLANNPSKIVLVDGRAGLRRDVENINAYLIPYRNVYVQAATNPLQGLSSVVNGSKPADGGGLIFDGSFARILRSVAGGQADVIRPFFGAHDATHGSSRFCIWCEKEQYNQLKHIPEFAARFEIVSNMRSKSKKSLTAAGADTPYLFQQVRQRGDEIVFQIPRHSSEERQYYPVATLPQGAIVGDGGFAFFDPTLWNISIFLSQLSLVWIAAVCGKIKDDYRFSNTLGWNTFPVPTLTEKNKADLTRCAEDILLAREHYFPATIADMYDPDLMDEDFPLVREAHERNDETLERIYIGRRFKNDTERLEKLFDLYTKMTAAEGAV